MSEENPISHEFAKFDNLTAEDLVKAFGTLKSQKEEQEEQLKHTNALYDFLRLIKIPQMFEQREISMLKVAGVGRCQLAGDLHASIVSSKKEEAFQFLRDSGRSGLIQEAVNSSTLKAAMKDAIKQGEEIPEDLIRITPFTRASLVKG